MNRYCTEWKIHNSKMQILFAAQVTVIWQWKRWNTLTCILAMWWIGNSELCRSIYFLQCQMAATSQLRRWILFRKRFFTDFLIQVSRLDISLPFFINNPQLHAVGRRRWSKPAIPIAQWIYLNINHSLAVESKFSNMNDCSKSLSKEIRWLSFFILS